MLEFYPMPTNLNNGGGLYTHHHHPHHHHHAANHTHPHTHHQNSTTVARFLDNSSNNISNSNIINNNNNNNNNINNNNSNNNSNNNDCATTNSQGLTNNGNTNIFGQQTQQHQHQQQQQQQQQILQMTTTSAAAYATCPQLTGNTTGSNVSSNTIPTALVATTSLTTPTYVAPSSTPQTIAACNTSSIAPTPTPTLASVPGAIPATIASSLSSSAATPTAAASLTSCTSSSPITLSSSSGGTAMNTCTNASISVVMLSATLSSTTASASAAATATPITPTLTLTAPSAATPVTVHGVASANASTSLLSLASVTAAAKLSADCNGRTEVGHIKCEKVFEICEGCGQKIHDRYLMNVGDTNWHENCMACCYCGMQLHHTCYVRNTKLYCKLDYDRLFGIKCAACCHPILSQEMVMRPIPNFVFHLTCFICYACRLPLQKGEQFMLRDGQLFCFRHDIEKELYLATQHCGYVGLDEDELMRPRDGRRGPKRPRTILTAQQRKQFKASFDQSPKPCRKVREALAKDTGLSVRVVQVWFQNQRAKMKKIQRKAKNGGSSANNSGGNNARNSDDKEKDKDEKSIKQESISGSESGYLGLDSTFASQPLNPNLPFSPDDYPANSNDSFCSSDLSLDGSNFDHLDDDADSLSLNNLELQSTGSSGNHHHHHHHHHQHHSNPQELIANLNTSLINPIDKLYLMQNSYFNSEQ